jgi:hypothetical protein
MLSELLHEQCVTATITLTRPESQKLVKKMARECLDCTLYSCGPAAQVPCIHPILQHIHVYKFRIARERVALQGAYTQQQR